MIDVLIKYFSLTWCGIYSFTKFTNNKLNIKNTIIFFPITFLTTLIAYFFRTAIPPMNIIIIYSSILLFSLLTHKKSISSTLIITTIAFGLCFAFYAISILLIIPIAYVLFATISNTFILDSLTATVIGIIQILSLHLLFKIQRFKNGIIKLEDKLNPDLGVIISLITIFIISIIYTSEYNRRIGISILFLLILSGLLMYFYFKKYITNKYISKVQKRNTEILETELADQNETIANLTRHNEELSKIIHRDNKLIPAMQLAVEEILNCESPDEQKEKSRALLPQLKTMAEKRTGILTKYEKDNKQLPATGIVSLDSSLKYLLNKAKEQDISLNLSINTDAKSLMSVIEENDLNTLILDLGENAVIATSSADIRNILIVIGAENRSFCISIYDSGNQFEPRVIANLGIKRITTHKKTGGSGIGMMTTFELLKKYQASFILNEMLQNESYCKQIKLCFDGQNECRILTERKDVLNIISKRKDIISN